MIEVTIAPGELIDKISILTLKKEFITNKDQLTNINFELNTLKPLIKKHKLDNTEIDKLSNELYEINKTLWIIEDDIREKEKKAAFDKEFIELARSVYFTNDKRSEIKKKINIISGSKIVEEKSYSDYKN